MTQPLVLKASYQRAYRAAFGKTAPDVRITHNGGFYAGWPVNKQYTAADLVKVTRFFNREAQ